MKQFPWFKLFAIVVIVAICVWVFRYITTPPPGKAYDDQGREHVAAAVVAQAKYNSNPPTSGPHLATWVKPGIYEEPMQTGELIHSLEHGYIVIHHRCGEGDPENEASGSTRTKPANCKDIVQKLTDIANRKKLYKLVVVPSETIEHPIVLAAWNRLLPLNAVDEKKIIEFIDYYRDHGPEQTME